MAKLVQLRLSMYLAVLVLFGPSAALVLLAVPNLSVAPDSLAAPADSAVLVTSVDSAVAADSVPSVALVASVVADLQ